MRKTKITLSLLTAFSALACGLAGFCFAWLTGATTDINISDLRGGVISQYFHCGDGSENDPFVITRPVHLYNMTELYDKLDGFADSDYHFQLGYDLDSDGDLEVFNYDDNGVYLNNYSDSLNMNDYEGLLPITPFGGSFDGSSLIIDNLHISGSGNSDIGFFGYVDSGATIHDLYIDHLTVDTTDAVASGHNHGNAYVGYLAGHIEDATRFSNTYVNNCRITGQSILIKNDWGYFGRCENAASLEVFVDKAAAGDAEAWGGSINSHAYTNLLYSLNHSTTGTTSTSFSGDGGYVVNKTASATTNPNTSQVIYRLREGSYIPLKFTDDAKTQAALGNTGYLIGSNVGTGVNASPKISSYKMVNIQNAISNTQSTSMANAYKADNIPYDDSKLEVLTYQNGWKRIIDDHNASNNSTNRAITSYTRTSLDSLGFTKYAASRDALQETLESSNFIHGIHFDNNAISTSSLLTVPAGVARVQGHTVSTSYQLPKGSIDFNLKEEGIINFFAGTYNSSQVNLNFFSLYQVTRNASGNITALTQIKKIYHATSGGYIYQTGNSKPSGAGDLAFDVETILHGNAPVINMMYYFEIPVNAGEYAMGVAGSTQGAYMIYLDLGANGSTEEGLVDDFTTIEYRSAPDTVEHNILLISYSQLAGQSLTVQVVYDDRKYYITTVNPNQIAVHVTILNTDYAYYYNNSVIANPAIQTYTFTS